ncbi:MAG: hypothetical protein PHQ23_08205 [Candidatus Wallbacteria bacterium]|nr:hypothetical protein [Candidatus Wallbacteria bacterium]
MQVPDRISMEEVETLEGVRFELECYFNFQSSTGVREPLIAFPILPITAVMRAAILVLLFFSLIPACAADITATLDSSNGSSGFSFRDSAASEIGRIDSNGNAVFTGGLRLDTSGVKCTTAEMLIVDGSLGVGTESPAYSVEVAGNARINSMLYVGTKGSVFKGTDQGGAIELGPINSAGSEVPYIDFHFGVGIAQDWNVRLINSDNNVFNIVTAASGEVLTVNKNAVGIGTTTPVSGLVVYEPQDRPCAVTLDCKGTSSGQYGRIDMITAGDGTKWLGNAGTKGWHLAARGNAYTTAAEQNDLMLFYYDGASWNYRQHWDSAGNVGIGTSPSYKLDVAGDIKLTGVIVNSSYIQTRADDQHLWIRQSDGTNRFALRTSDGNGHGMTWTTGWKDLAENMRPGAGETVEAGDLVMTDSRSRNRIVRTDRPYCSTLIGAISTKPGLLMNQDVEGKDDRGKPVALAGRTPVKVCTCNGVIRIGDPITSSAVPGVGMKASRAGHIIGIAMEDFPYSEPVGDPKADAIDGTPYRMDENLELEGREYRIGKIALFVNPGWHATE